MKKASCAAGSIYDGWGILMAFQKIKIFGIRDGKLELDEDSGCFWCFLI